MEGLRGGDVHWLGKGQAALVSSVHLKVEVPTSKRAAIVRDWRIEKRHENDDVLSSVLVGEVMCHHLSLIHDLALGENSVPMHL